jgi:hypothetical protein
MCIYHRFNHELWGLENHTTKEPLVSLKNTSGTHITMPDINKDNIIQVIKIFSAATWLITSFQLCLMAKTYFIKSFHCHTVAPYWIAHLFHPIMASPQTHGTLKYLHNSCQPCSPESL